MTPIWTPLAASWVAAHLGEDFGAHRALGVFDRHARIAAGVVLHNWNPRRGVVEMTAAAVDPRWLTRAVAREVFDYAFGFARVAVAHCGASNMAVRRIWAACGAHEAVIPHLWGAGEAAVILTIREPMWRASPLGRKCR